MLLRPVRMSPVASSLCPRIASFALVRPPSQLRLCGGPSGRSEAVLRAPSSQPQLSHRRFAPMPLLPTMTPARLAPVSIAARRLLSTAGAPQGDAPLAEEENAGAGQWNNVSGKIAEMMDRNLHKQAGHPLFLIKRAIEAHFANKHKVLVPHDCRSEVHFRLIPP
jgi:hypothetical protein